MNVISKEDAIEQGLIYYFTGKPCKHGHISERMVKGGSCRTCKNFLAQSQRNNNREEYNKYCREKKKESYTTEKRRALYIKNNVKELFYAAKQRAKVKGISFTITLEDVIIPNSCPVFGIPLDHRDKHHTPTLDRKVNDLGYVKGNVQVISEKANRIKTNGTIEDFEQIISYMKNGNNT